MGANGPVEVKQHIWFKDFDWKAMMEKKVKAVFVPNAKIDNFDPRASCNNLSDSENAKQHGQLLKKEDVQNFFSGYYFNIEDDRTTKPTNNTINIPLGKEDSD